MKIGRIEAITSVSRIEPIVRAAKKAKVPKTQPGSRLKKVTLTHLGGIETGAQSSVHHTVIRDENRGKHVDITIDDRVFTYFLNILY